MVIDARVFALTTAITFGLAPVLIKMAYRRGGTTGTGMILALSSAVAVNVALMLVVAPRFELLTPPAVAAFILGGLAGNALGRRWSFQSIDLLGPSRSSALRGSSPVITALLALLIYQEAVTPVRWAAILAIVLGGVLVTWLPGSPARQWLGIGVFYALAASVSYGIRPIFFKFGLEIADAPLAATLIGALAALAYTVVREDRGQLGLGRLDAAFGFFLAAGLVGAVGLVSLTFGLAAGEVSVVYPLTSSAPLFTVVFTALLLRGVEQVTWRLVAGAAMVVGGVVYL